MMDDELGQNRMYYGLMEFFSSQTSTRTGSVVSACTSTRYALPSLRSNITILSIAIRLDMNDMGKARIAEKRWCGLTFFLSGL